MGTGEVSWGSGVGQWGGGVVRPGFSSDRDRGANATQIGVSIQSQLVWLYHMQDIDFRQIHVSFVLLWVNSPFSLSSFFFLPLNCLISWSLVGAAGGNFLGKQRNSTGEFSQRTDPLPFFSISSGSHLSKFLAE